MKPVSKEREMKKFWVVFFVFIFCAGGTAIARNKGQGKGQNRDQTGYEQPQKKGNQQYYGDEAGKNKNRDRDRDQDRERVKENNGGKKSEPPKGVQQAAEKGKGRKKGFWQRWFGGDKE
jgi:hypothetical protein